MAIIKSKFKSKKHSRQNKSNKHSTNVSIKKRTMKNGEIKKQKKTMKNGYMKGGVVVIIEKRVVKHILLKS